MTNVTRSKNAGFATVEMMGALLVLLVLLPALAKMVNWGVVEMQKRSAATHLASVGGAAAKYALKHGATLLTQATATSGPMITLTQLRSEGFLPQAFGDRNSWGQGYSVHVREPRAGQLQVVVLTDGGRGHESGGDFGTVVAPSAAALVDGPGGFIPTGTIPGQSAGVLRGAYGAWEVDLVASGIANPGAGHIGYLSSLDASALGQDFLYRVAVPGAPELNTMFTDLDMRDHAVKGVKEAQFVSHTLASQTGFCSAVTDEGKVFLDAQQGLYVCRDGKVQAISDTGNSLLVKHASIFADGDLVPKPECPPGVSTSPEVFLSPVTYAAASMLSPPLVSVQAWATDFSESAWQVHLRLMTADPRAATPVWINPPKELGQVMVMTICRAN